MQCLALLIVLAAGAEKINGNFIIRPKERFSYSDEELIVFPDVARIRSEIPQEQNSTLDQGVVSAQNHTDIQDEDGIVFEGEYQNDAAMLVPKPSNVGPWGFGTYFVKYNKREYSDIAKSVGENFETEISAVHLESGKFVDTTLDSDNFENENATTTQNPLMRTLINVPRCGSGEKMISGRCRLVLSP